MEITQEQAYTLELLGKIMQAKGLPILLDGLEATAAQVYLGFKEWAELSAKATLNPVDDVVVSFFPQVDILMVPQIDKINGKVG